MIFESEEIRQNKRAKIWKAFEIKRIKFYPKNQKLIKKALDEQIELVVDAIEKYGTGVDVAMNLDLNKMYDEIEQMYVDTGYPFATGVYRGLKKRVKARISTDKEIFQSEMKDYVKTYAFDLIKNINRTNEKVVRKKMQEAASKGLGAKETAMYMRREWNNLSVGRSKTIARTETVRASNVAGQFAAEKIQKDTGLILQKEWITTIDGNERPEHKDANGQKVPLNGKFTVGGEWLEHPSDPDGEAGNTINCRCAVGYVSNFLNE